MRFNNFDKLRLMGVLDVLGSSHSSWYLMLDIDVWGEISAVIWDSSFSTECEELLFLVKIRGGFLIFLDVPILISGISVINLNLCYNTIF